MTLRNSKQKLVAPEKRDMSRRPTIYDVSRCSGFSTATVSRVFANYHGVSQSTRDRVLAVSRELGFSPSHIGRCLAQGSTGNVAVMFPDMASGFYAEVLAGIDEVLAEHGFNTLTAFYGRGRDAKSVFTRLNSGFLADALIIASSYDIGDVSQWSGYCDTPMVLLDRPLAKAGISTVCIDNASGVAAMVRHLHTNGHRRIAVISGPEGTWDAEERMASYRAAMQEIKLEVNPLLIWAGNFTFESGRHAMRTALAGRLSADAVFCFNDEMALGAIAAINEAGLRVPDDIAVAGFDGISAAEGVRLTTVACPMRTVGRSAGTMAVSLIKGTERPTDQVIPVRLVIRYSSGKRAAHWTKAM
jgi:DNA-binding LacI/PurR family transcriptional regulator